MDRAMPKIYFFYTSKDDDGYDFVALAEDGMCLSSWRSQSEESAKSEAKSSERLECYHAYYPDGWVPVWRGGPINPDTMPSLRPNPEGSLGFIEGRLYQQFLRALTV
jgi:hypothetical protein